MAKLPFGVSFCELFLCAYGCQRKSGLTISTHFISLTAAPLSANIFTFVGLFYGAPPHTPPSPFLKKRAWNPKNFTELVFCPTASAQTPINKNNSVPHSCKHGSVRNYFYCLTFGQGRRGMKLLLLTLHYEYHNDREKYERDSKADRHGAKNLDVVIFVLPVHIGGGRCIYARLSSA